MKIENITKFLNLAKQSPVQAFEWLGTLNISREDFLVSTINAGYITYISDLLKVEGMRVGPKALIAACKKGYYAYLSDLCKKAEITDAGAGDAVLVAAIEAGYNAYISDLLKVEGMRVGPKALIAACKKGYYAYLSDLCKKAEITDAGAGDAVLVAAIEAGYNAYISNLLEIKGINVTSSTLQYALRKSNLASLYALYKKAGCKVDEVIEHEFNTRVLALLQIEREKHTRSGIFFDFNKNPKISSNALNVILNGQCSYDKSTLEQVCFNDELLAAARNAGIFGKGFLKDCLWEQLQNRCNEGKLNSWLEGTVFEELLDLLVLFKNQFELNTLLSLLIREKSPVQYVAALIEAQAETADDMAFVIEAADKRLLEKIIANQNKKTVYDKFQLLEELFSERYGQSPQICEDIKILRGKFLEQYQEEQEKEQAAFEEKQRMLFSKQSDNTNSPAFFKQNSKNSPTFSKVQTEQKHLDANNNGFWATLFAHLESIVHFMLMFFSSCFVKNDTARNDNYKKQGVVSVLNP